jgi:hypothetical protein
MSGLQVVSQTTRLPRPTENRQAIAVVTCFSALHASNLGILLRFVYPPQDQGALASHLAVVCLSSRIQANWRKLLSREIFRSLAGFGTPMAHSRLHWARHNWQPPIATHDPCCGPRVREIKAARRVTAAAPTPHTKYRIDSGPPFSHPFRRKGSRLLYVEGVFSLQEQFPSAVKDAT